MSSNSQDSSIQPFEAASTSHRVLRFGVFEALLQSGELKKEGSIVRIRHQPFKVLTLLAERAGDLVTREEIQRALWHEHDLVDFEQGLNYCIKEIRQALGDRVDSPRFVQTLPRRGYRFIAPVTAFPVTPIAAEPPEPAAASEQPSVPASEPGRLKGRARFLTLGAGIAAAALIWFGGRERDSLPTATPGPARVLVLPFDDLSEPRDPLFADGLTEEVIAHIGRANPLRLVALARASSLSLRGERDLPRIARELQVDYFVEGSVRRSGATTRVTASLVRSSDQARLWSESIDREPKDLIAFQSGLAERVARGVDTAAVSALGTPRVTRSSDAYVHYLRARTLWGQRDRKSVEEALRGFERATALEPGFAPAWVGIADSYYTLTDHGHMPARDGWLLAKAAADRAVSLDPRLAEAWASVGMYHALFEWNWTRAREAFLRSLSLNPGIANTHHWFGLLRVAQGQPEAAIESWERALALDPLSSIYRGNLAQALALVGRFDDARRNAQTIIDVRPDWTGGWVWMARVHSRAGDWAKARASAERGIALEPTSFGLALLARICAKLNDVPCARASRERLRGDGKIYKPPYYLALAALALGEKDAAIFELNRAIEERSPLLRNLAHSEDWQDLRSDPRFGRIVALLGGGGQRARGPSPAAEAAPSVSFH